jgi:hypothetical protein
MLMTRKERVGFYCVAPACLLVHYCRRLHTSLSSV